MGLIGDEFITTFRRLNQHFYTRNKVDCWRYLFEQKKYQELLKHSWFISKIINEIEKLEDISIEVLEYWNKTIGENSIYGKGNPTTQLLLSKMNMMKNIEILNYIFIYKKKSF